MVPLFIQALVVHQRMPDNARWITRHVLKPETAKRNHHNERNERNETTEMAKTTKTSASKTTETKPPKQPKRPKQNNRDELNLRTTTDGPKKPNSCLSFVMGGEGAKATSGTQGAGNMISGRAILNNKRVVRLPVAQLIQRKSNMLKFILILRHQLST